MFRKYERQRNQDTDRVKVETYGEVYPGRILDTTGEIDFVVERRFKENDKVLDTTGPKNQIK